MYANINNIRYTEDGQYDIITEYSKLPVETVSTKAEALEFIRGYIMKTCKTEFEAKGRILRNFVEEDMLSGHKYLKVRDIDLVAAV